MFYHILIDRFVPAQSSKKGRGYKGGNLSIISHTTASGHSGLYDLQGRRLNHEPAHGIYIHNGRKVVR